MFLQIIRKLPRLSRCFSSRTRMEGSIPDIRDPRFWEHDSRPIPNVVDSVLHVVTQENQHIEWERSHEKLVLVGEVAVGASRISFSKGEGVQFILKTSTIVEEEVGYRVLEQFHYLIVMQETLRQRVLKILYPGVAMMVTAGIHYRLKETRDDINMKFIPFLFVEGYRILVQQTPKILK